MSETLIADIRRVASRDYGDNIIISRNSVHAVLDALEEAHGALREIDGLEVMEINPSNYDHEIVCELSRNAAYAGMVARNSLEKLNRVLSVELAQ